MQPKKILFLSSWYPDRITRANGDFVKRHAQTAALNNQVYAFFVKHDPEMKQKTELVETQEGNYSETILYFIVSRGFGYRFMKLVRYFKYYRRGYHHIRDKFGTPDIIHANIIYPIGIVAWWYHRMFGCPYVMAEHWSAYLPVNNRRLGFFRKKLDGFVVRKAERLLPVTNNMGKSLRDLGFRNRYEVVPNVVDIEGFSPAGKVASDNRFVHLSTLNDRTKNISGMMRAVQKLSERRKDFTLDIIGIEEIGKYISYARELGIYDTYVRIYPQIEHYEVPDQLRKSRCLLMFSNFESLPCVIIEALASGIPVISSHVGGIGEYIGPKEGILVEKGDEDALARAMDHMLDHFREFDPAHLREHVELNFSPEAISRKLDSIYQSIPENA